MIYITIKDSEVTRVDGMTEALRIKLIDDIDSRYLMFASETLVNIDRGIVAIDPISGDTEIYGCTVNREELGRILSTVLGGEFANED